MVIPDRAFTADWPWSGSACALFMSRGSEVWVVVIRFVVESTWMQITLPSLCISTLRVMGLIRAALTAGIVNPVLSS